MCTHHRDDELMNAMVWACRMPEGDGNL